jgi:OmpA-OmpF porin, OOP family
MRPRRALLPACFALATLLIATAARAQDPTPSLAFEPAPAGDPCAGVERAAVRGHLLVSGRLFADYARSPLVLVNAAQVDDRIVTDQLWLHALASFSILHRFVVHVDVPFTALQAGADAPLSGATAPRVDPNAAFGDVRLGARARLVGTDEDAPVQVNLALSSMVWLPTASEGYTGDGSVRAAISAVADGSTPRLYWAITGGAVIRPLATLPGILPSRTGAGLHLGFAAGVFADAARTIAIGAEAVADLTLDGARLFDPRASVAHLLLTGHHRIAGGPFEIGAAFGPGVGQGAGAAEYRVMGFFGYAPTRAAPPPDEDEDGIPDRSDACIDIDGVSASDPLLHGCPEPPRDRDGDAIPDQYDACPRVPGEPTAERKTHGCPRVMDADRDGVPDPEDACPKEAGVKPPSPDDGAPGRPAAPSAPSPEGDGCPKPEPAAPPSAAELVADVIVLSQMVQFETGTATLRPESDPLLNEVARILKEHPELELVEVQGHTDERGSADLNRKLGQERGESVVAWLVARGIAADRLVAKGYGSDRPIADNTTDEGRAKNRRVELRVLRTKEGATKSDATKSDTKSEGAK